MRFDLTENWFEFCENISDLNIHSSHSGIYISVVWFSGYSKGSLIADFQKSDCGLVYLELNPALQIDTDNYIS